jgi:hypothetical protein
MHSEQTKLQFIELRAQEKTLEEISTTLNVCKRTLVDWNREFAHDIADLREVERESLRRKLFGTTHDWMKGELDHYKRLDEELARRKFQYSPTESVFRMRADSRKTIEKFLFAESPLDRHPRKSDRAETLNRASPTNSGSPTSPLPRGEGQGEGQTGTSSGRSGIPRRSPLPRAAATVATPTSVGSDLHTVTDVECALSLPPRGEGRDEGQTSIPVVAHNPETTVASPADSHALPPNPLEPDGFTGSIVINPLESAQAIIEKCLQPEPPDHSRAHEKPGQN